MFIKVSFRGEKKIKEHLFISLTICQLSKAIEFLKNEPYHIYLIAQSLGLSQVDIFNILCVHLICYLFFASGHATKLPLPHLPVVRKLSIEIQTNRIIKQIKYMFS